MTPTFPTEFPFAVGDVLTLERQTIYYQRSQSFRETTRTIKTLIVDADGEGAEVVFKESPNTYHLNLCYNGNAEIRGAKSRYEVQRKNGEFFAWHEIPLSELD
jgi:hypothetical protein